MEVIDTVLANSGDPIGTIVSWIALFMIVRWLLGYGDRRDNQGNEMQ